MIVQQMEGLQDGSDIAELGRLTSHSGGAGSDLITMNEKPTGSDPFSSHAPLSQPLLPASEPEV